jgi:hypothetical protein
LWRSCSQFSTRRIRAQRSPRTAQRTRAGSPSSLRSTRVGAPAVRALPVLVKQHSTQSSRCLARRRAADHPSAAARRRADPSRVAAESPWNTCTLATKPSGPKLTQGGVRMYITLETRDGKPLGQVAVSRPDWPVGKRALRGAPEGNLRVVAHRERDGETVLVVEEVSGTRQRERANGPLYGPAPTPSRCLPSRGHSGCRLASNGFPCLRVSGQSRCPRLSRSRRL